MIVAILLPMDELAEQHPYIPIKVEILVITTLVKSRACYNVISFDFFHTLDNVELIHDATTTQSFIDCMAIFTGKVFL